MSWRHQQDQIHDVTIYFVGCVYCNLCDITKDLKNFIDHFVLEMRFLSDKTTHLTRHVKEAAIPAATGCRFTRSGHDTYRKNVHKPVQSNKIGRTASLHSWKQPKNNYLTNVVIRVGSDFSTAMMTNKPFCRVGPLYRSTSGTRELGTPFFLLPCKRI